MVLDFTEFNFKCCTFLQWKLRNTAEVVWISDSQRNVGEVFDICVKELKKEHFLFVKICSCLKGVSIDVIPGWKFQCVYVAWQYIVKLKILPSAYRTDLPGLHQWNSVIPAFHSESIATKWKHFGSHFLHVVNMSKSQQISCYLFQANQTIDFLCVWLVVLAFSDYSNCQLLQIGIVFY